MKEVINVLKYWSRTEYFQPFYPNISIGDFVTLDSISEKPPWENTNEKNLYTLYYGELINQTLIELLFKRTCLENEDVEDDYTKNCLFSYKVTPNGKYVKESFKISPFIWAVSKMISSSDLKVHLSKDMCDEFDRNINTMLTADKRHIDLSIAKKIEEVILKRLCLELDVEFKIYIEKKKLSEEEARKINENEEIDLDEMNDIMKSFYFEDLVEVTNSIDESSKLIKYIKGIKNENIVKIDSDIEKMKEWTNPDKYPLGKWPSPYSPCLMQQLAINISIDKEQDIFSVNGPPGTGKTTLLKEVIASNIVERAIRMIEYTEVDDAFTSVELESSQNKYIKKYFKLDDAIAHYGIIVASNNNAAVENISLELPKLDSIKESLSECFADINKDIYFGDISKKVNNDETSWGLISARMGNQSNINNFINNMWFDKNCGLMKKYSEEIPSWKKTKSEFLVILKQVKQKRDKIKNEIIEIEQLDKLCDMKKKLENNITILREQIDEINFKVEMMETNLARLKNELVLKDSLTESARLKLNLWKRILHNIGVKQEMVIEYNNQIDEKKNLLMKIDEINVLKEKIINDRICNERKINSIRSELKMLSLKITKIENLYNDCIIKYKNNFAAGAFWNHILKNKKSQLSSPWTYKEYDELRERLFYSALQLHKAFILNSKSIKNNINVYINNRDLSLKERKESKADLINTIQLIVPVVSTTFASVSKWLSGAKEDSLGLLIVDEAGQATPKSSIGGLWRSKKVMIVGDPLQVEPIDIIPKQLKEVFLKEYNLDMKYGFKNQSVQTYADKINKFGGEREVDDVKLWLGCPLIVHRRCKDPMFSISNAIAYDNIMFNETLDPKEDNKYVISESMWFSIKGDSKGSKNHYVENQGKFIIENISAFAYKHNKLPDIYIISPFTSVVRGLQKSLDSLLQKLNRDKVVLINNNDRKEIIKNIVGTVHTFQGKEANEVYLVLGCDKNNGKGAANWVGTSPNILNVAVTRGKFKLGIVGDYDLWKNVKYFDTVAEYLQVSKVNY